MSLQNVVLPEIAIIELFKGIFMLNEELSGQSPAEPGIAIQKSFKFLGNNQKNITIIVQNARDVFLPERHLEFLTKILGACKLNIGDVAIVNHGITPVDINLLKQQLEPNKVILFGVEPLDIKLPFNFPLFKIQEYAQSSYIHVPSLDGFNSETEQGKLFKTRLWDCLKSLFSLSNIR